MASGNKIREILKSKGMTQRELAYRLDTGETYISKVINGSINMREDFLWKLCDALECDPKDIRDIK